MLVHNPAVVDCSDYNKFLSTKEHLSTSEVWAYIKANCPMIRHFIQTSPGRWTWTNHLTNKGYGRSGLNIQPLKVKGPTGRNVWYWERAKIDSVERQILIDSLQRLRNRAAGDWEYKLTEYTHENVKPEVALTVVQVSP